MDVKMATSREAANEKLISAVENNCVSDAIAALLGKGADPNCRYHETGQKKCFARSVTLVDGDTPLHIAARKGETTLVKLLIVFDAELEPYNQKQERPQDVAEPPCLQIIKTVLTLRKKLKPMDPPRTAKQPPEPDDDDVFLLCLDGGGIRGLVFIQVLIELDKRREQLYGSGSKSFLSYFNWMAGTSTGGIAALTLATKGRNPKCGRDPIKGRQMYFKLKDKVLKGSPPFPNDQVNKAMISIFEESKEKVMSDIKDCNVAVMTTLAETKPPKLHLMRTYGDGSTDDGQVGPDKRHIWEAARASSAAVPYFHPFGKFIDGGFIANNPTVDALVDIQRHFKTMGRKANVKAVISLGCGDSPPDPFSIDEDEADCDPQMRELKPKTREKLEKTLLPKKDGQRPRVETDSAQIKQTKELLKLVLLHPINNGKVIQLCINQTTQPSGEVVKRGEAFSEALGAKYSRVSPQLDEDVHFLETEDKKLIEMLYTTVLYMLENHTEKMDQVLEAVMGCISIDT